MVQLANSFLLSYSVYDGNGNKALLLNKKDDFRNRVLHIQISLQRYQHCGSFNNTLF
jgi:hypothetical protein